MKEKSKSIKSDLKKVDTHLVKPKEYDELPELTDEMFNRAIYKVGGIEKAPPRRRGPQKAPTKIPVHLRLSREVVTYFRSEGPGWQTKIGDILKSWIKTHPHSGNL